MYSCLYLLSAESIGMHQMQTCFCQIKAWFVLLSHKHRLRKCLCESSSVCVFKDQDVCPTIPGVSLLRVRGSPCMEVNRVKEKKKNKKGKVCFCCFLFLKEVSRSFHETLAFTFHWPNILFYVYI
jgi:hypothetical protein